MYVHDRASSSKYNSIRSYTIAYAHQLQGKNLLEVLNLMSFNDLSYRISFSAPIYLTGSLACLSPHIWEHGHSIPEYDDFGQLRHCAI